MDWLAAAPKLIALIYSLMQLVVAQRERNVGWAAAVSYGMQIAANQVSAAADEMNNAEEIHAKDKSDGAFDPTFKRSE